MRRIQFGQYLSPHVKHLTTAWPPCTNWTVTEQKDMKNPSRTDKCLSIFLNDHSHKYSNARQLWWLSLCCFTTCTISSSITPIHWPHLFSGWLLARSHMAVWLPQPPTPQTPTPTHYCSPMLFLYPPPTYSSRLHHCMSKVAYDWDHGVRSWYEEGDCEQVHE